MIKMHRKSSEIPVYLKPLLATIVVPGLLLSFLFTGCAKDPVKEAEDKFLSKGDVIGAVQFLENATKDRANYNESARTVAKAKLKQLYPEYYLKLAPKNFSDAESLLSQEKYKKAIEFYQLIPEAADEYQKAQSQIEVANKKLLELQEKERVEKLQNNLIGEWKGTLFAIMVNGRLNPLYEVQLRINNLDTIRYVTSLDKLFGGQAKTIKYKFDPMPIYVEKVIKDDFGDVKERIQIEAYSLKFNFNSGGHFRFLVFDSDNQISLYTHEFLIKDKYLRDVVYGDLQQKIVLTRS